MTRIIFKINATYSLSYDSRNYRTDPLTIFICSDNLYALSLILVYLVCVSLGVLKK